MARILDITPAEYHADPCEVPSLSASAAKTIILKSPAHCWLEHPRLGQRSRESSDSMGDGTIIHELVLGKGSGIVVVEANDFRTKAAQEQRDAAYAAGKTPVIAKKMEAYTYAADQIRKRITDLLQRPIPTLREVCIEWTYTLDRRIPGKDEKAIVLCRSMLDAVDLETGLIFDLKTPEAGPQLNIEKKMCNMGYDIQAVAYTLAVEQLVPALAGRVTTAFAFAEIEPPYSVTIGMPSGAMRSFGESRWHRAADKWQACLSAGRASKHWPHYADRIVSLYPPVYEIQREEEIIGAEL